MKKLILFLVLTISCYSQQNNNSIYYLVAPGIVTSDFKTTYASFFSSIEVKYESFPIAKGYFGMNLGIYTNAYPHSVESGFIAALSGARISFGFSPTLKAIENKVYFDVRPIFSYRNIINIKIFYNWTFKNINLIIGIPIKL